MGARLDLLGERFGKWVVLEEALSHRIPAKERKRARCIAQWTCLCDCGNRVIVRTDSLRSGRSTGCGCDRNEKTGQRATTHGYAPTSGSKPEYNTWASIIQRCNNPNNPAYPNYGGRGISVCQRWRDSFADFLTDMGPRPTRHSIDRINNNGNYEPGNCRWATNPEQSLNKRTNVVVTAFGVTAPLIDLWRRFCKTGISFSGLAYRVRDGWSPEEALTAPPRSKRLLSQGSPPLI